MRRVVFGPHGIDEVELVLSPHPGAAALSDRQGCLGAASSHA